MNLPKFQVKLKNNILIKPKQSFNIVLKPKSTAPIHNNCIVLPTKVPVAYGHLEKEFPMRTRQPLTKSYEKLSDTEKNILGLD